MTEYLVVHQTAKYCGISIEPAGRRYDHPTECWAIRSGKQFVFARMKMAKLLDTFYFGGSYEKMAHYIVTYDEMCAIVESHMGPSDRKRYELAMHEARGPDWFGAVPNIVVGTIETLTLLVARSARLVAVVVIVPLALRWLNKHTKN